MAQSPNNRTIQLSDYDRELYNKKVINLPFQGELINVTINNDLFNVIDYIPNSIVDLVFIDPPYNLNKNFDNFKFKESSLINYQTYLESWLPKVISKLKPNGSLYICGDWKSCTPIQTVLEKYMTIRNRITFERDKGRGSKSNWKNSSEDIWFATLNNDYYFNVDAVKLKRKVLAPYKTNDIPKDWVDSDDGKFRLTHPSNLWTDITIPFWSMPENTDHPTQKPEKLLAKIILASSKEGDLILDPFLGSGTTSVVAKKLCRNYIGVEQSLDYCILTEKRLALAEVNKTIQGYSDNIFYERNSN